MTLEPMTIEEVDQDSKHGEYQLRTFEELRAELLYHLPHVYRAIQLVPIIYDRLTLIDGRSHKEAFSEICKIFAQVRRSFPDERGLCDRNLYRYLPEDNPHVPRRTHPPDATRQSQEERNHSPLATEDAGSPTKPGSESSTFTFSGRAERAIAEIMADLKDAVHELELIKVFELVLMNEMLPTDQRVFLTYKAFRKEHLSEQIYNNFETYRKTYRNKVLGLPSQPATSGTQSVKDQCAT